MFSCSSCAAVLRPGQLLCNACGQVFTHPVPDAVPEGEYRSFYWPPKQQTQSEDVLRQAQNWWSGLSARNKALGGGAIAIILFLCWLPHPTQGGLEQIPGGLHPYTNPQPPPFQVPASAAPTYTGGPVDRTGNRQPAPVYDPSPQPSYQQPTYTQSDSASPSSAPTDQSYSPPSSTDAPHQDSEELRQARGAYDIDSKSLDSARQELARDQQALTENENAPVGSSADIPTYKEEVRADQYKVDYDQNAVDKDLRAINDASSQH